MKIRYAKMSKAFKVKFFVGATVVLMVSLIGMVMLNFNDAEYVVTVTGKERITELHRTAKETLKHHQNIWCTQMVKMEILLCLKTLIAVSVGNLIVPIYKAS